MKTWKEVTTIDVQKLAATATEGRLAQAITKIEWHIMDLVEAPNQEESTGEMKNCLMWKEILKQKYNELAAARLEEMEHPSKCPLKPAPKCIMIPLTRKQQKEIQKRKSKLPAKL